MRLHSPTLRLSIFKGNSTHVFAKTSVVNGLVHEPVKVNPFSAIANFSLCSPNKLNLNMVSRHGSKRAERDHTCYESHVILYYLVLRSIGLDFAASSLAVIEPGEH